MKSRTSTKGSAYPAINAAYWQPAPVPGPYLVPGTPGDLIREQSVRVDVLGYSVTFDECCAFSPDMSASSDRNYVQNCIVLVVMLMVLCRFTN